MRRATPCPHDHLSSTLDRLARHSSTHSSHTSHSALRLPYSRNVTYGIDYMHTGRTTAPPRSSTLHRAHITHHASHNPHRKPPHQHRHHRSRSPPPPSSSQPSDLAPNSSPLPPWVTAGSPRTPSPPPKQPPQVSSRPSPAPLITPRPIRGATPFARPTQATPRCRVRRTALRGDGGPPRLHRTRWVIIGKDE